MLNAAKLVCGDLPEADYTDTRLSERAPKEESGCDIQLSSRRSSRAAKSGFRSEANFRI
jgi:hypothetical protein